MTMSQRGLVVKITTFYLPTKYGLNFLRSRTLFALLQHFSVTTKRFCTKSFYCSADKISPRSSYIAVYLPWKANVERWAEESYIFFCEWVQLFLIWDIDEEIQRIIAREKDINSTPSREWNAIDFTKLNYELTQSFSVPTIRV